MSNVLSPFLLISLILSASLMVVSDAQSQTHKGFPPEVWHTDWSKHSVPLDEIEVNLPKDQIPTVNNPQFVSGSAASSWIDDDEPVIVVALDNDVRAYPLQILIWHEMVNDRIGDVPVTVTFCPLCYSALVYDRRVGAREFRFGVSGALRHSDLVMYDRETNSLWQQLSGEAIAGEMTGFTLRAVPAQIISFGQFRDSYPNGQVMSKETGFSRAYGTNPYPGYDNVNERPWLYKGKIDSRLQPMEKVVTLTVGTEHKAYPHKITRKLGAINDEVGGLAVVIVHSKEGAVSALDDKSIRRSNKIGSTGVFERKLPDGRELTFSFNNKRLVDDQTGSEWSITGLATTGPMLGTQLTPVPHGDIFSFAWLVIEPDTEIYSN